MKRAGPSACTCRQPRLAAREADRAITHGRAERAERLPEVERPRSVEAALDHRRIESRIGVRSGLGRLEVGSAADATVALGDDDLRACLAEAGARAGKQDDVGRVLAQCDTHAAREVVRR